MPEKIDSHVICPQKIVPAGSWGRLWQTWDRLPYLFLLGIFPCTALLFQCFLLWTHQHWSWRFKCGLQTLCHYPGFLCDPQDDCIKWTQTRAVSSVRNYYFFLEELSKSHIIITSNTGISNSTCHLKDTARSRASPFATKTSFNEEMTWYIILDIVCWTEISLSVGKSNYNPTVGHSITGYR